MVETRDETFISMNFELNSNRHTLRNLLSSLELPFKVYDCKLSHLK
jgi:hypothetical protein